MRFDIETAMAYREQREKEGIGVSPVLVGLAGKMRSGKSHISDLLVFKYGFASVAIAHPLYHLWELGISSRFFYCSRVEDYLRSIGEKVGKHSEGMRRWKELGKGIERIFQDVYREYRNGGDFVLARRLFLQRAGDELRSSWLGRDFLIEYCFYRIQVFCSAVSPSQQRFVISDIRLPSEALWVQQNGGKVFWVEVPEAKRMERVGKSASEESLNHRTEVFAEIVRYLPGVEEVSGEEDGIPWVIEEYIKKER